jgi:hypothetical protein
MQVAQVAGKLPQSSDGGGGRLENVMKEGLAQFSDGGKGGMLEDVKKDGTLEELDGSRLVPAIEKCHDWWMNVKRLHDQT